MNNDKTLRNSTKNELLKSETGLTPLQERAASLMVTGKSNTEIASDLNIDRSTLYNWINKITFKAYFNKLNKEIQDEVRSSLTGMYADAVQAVKDCLDKNENPSNRFKAACWLIGKLDEKKIGATDPRVFFRNLATSYTWSDNLGEVFDRPKYERLCQDNGIDPNDDK